jgi:hypothetical protein
MWLPLTPATLLSRLSEPEKQALDSVAVSFDQSAPLDAIALEIANEWRGGLRRVVVCDYRAGYIPDEILIHVLADYRYRAFTRLPNMRRYLDENRIEEWRRANTVRDNLQKVSIAAPDADYAESSESSGKPGPSISDADADAILG